MLLSGCSLSRFIPEDRYLLDKVSIESDSSDLKTGPFEGYIRQHPNSKWFNVFRVPVLPYMISGTDSTKRINRFLWRIGEKPVLADTLQHLKSRSEIEGAVRNLGYMNAEVDLVQKHHGREVDMKYRIHPGVRYKVAYIDMDIRDTAIAALVEK